MFAILGPPLTAALARLAGTDKALVIALAILGAGVAVPSLWPVVAMLFVSSVVFGAQPGLSSLMAARARDLGSRDMMPRFMRAMILANSCGAFLGGLFFPWAYGALASPALLFLTGGAALALAAAAAWPASGAVPDAAVAQSQPKPAR